MKIINLRTLFVSCGFLLCAIVQCSRKLSCFADLNYAVNYANFFYKLKK